MIIDISNEVFTKLKNTLTGINVVGEYPETIPTFPIVTFSESSNTTIYDMVDSSGETHNLISFEIEIFSNAKNKTTQVKTIRNNIDTVMSDFYGMNRVFSDKVPNYLDANIYRYMLRYECVVDKNKKIYRR